MVRSETATQANLERAARKLVAASRFQNLAKELCADGAVDDDEVDALAEQFRNCLKEEIALSVVREETVRQVAAKAKAASQVSQSSGASSSGDAEVRVVQGREELCETWEAANRRTAALLAEREAQAAIEAFWAQTSPSPADSVSRPLSTFVLPPKPTRNPEVIPTKITRHGRHLQPRRYIVQRPSPLPLRLRRRRVFRPTSRR